MENPLPAERKKEKNHMKLSYKLLGFLLMAMILMVALAPITRAGDVPDRAIVKLGTTGSATWTNTFAYAGIDLKRIFVESSYVAADTQTIKRVTSDGSYTDAVGTVAISANIGNTASFTAEYLKVGDMLTFTNTAASSNCVVLIDLIVQKH